jgi:Tfp pilus assembly protein PilO
LVGEYHDIGRCLARIASLPRIIKPSNLSIGLAPRSRATRDMVAALEVSMTIETFVLGGLTGQQPEGQGESPSG